MDRLDKDGKSVRSLDSLVRIHGHLRNHRWWAVAHLRLEEPVPLLWVGSLLKFGWFVLDTSPLL